MSLSRHVNPEDIVERLQNHHLIDEDEESTRSFIEGDGRDGVVHSSAFVSRYTSRACIPKYKISKKGAPADTVYHMIKEELDLDGQPSLNLASFVATWMDPEATKLMMDNINKNLSDADEYPAMMRIHARCVSILAHLWGVQPDERATGTATTGSSEAILLGGLAMKRRWMETRRLRGLDVSKPNIVMGANAQVALEKFANYFDVEARILPVSEESHHRLNENLIKDSVDENTIGVFVILGSTYTGHYEPVEAIAKILDEVQKQKGWDIPIHVDGASGGFIAPFSDAGAGQGVKWNFEIPRVKSINTSGHKFGLVYAGLGWVVWRDESYLPSSLVFHLDYLGSMEDTFTLNFSRPGGQMVAQYFNLVHLAREGYHDIMENCLANARRLSWSLEATGWYTVVSDIHRPATPSPTSASAGGNGVSSKISRQVKQAIKTTEKRTEDGKGTSASSEWSSAHYEAGLPVVAFRLSDEFRKENPHVRQESVSQLLRGRQWIVPNYLLPPNEHKTEIMRVVVRENMSLDMLERLVSDICEVTEQLMGMERDLDLSGLWLPRKNEPEGQKKGDRPHQGVC